MPRVSHDMAHAALRIDDNVAGDFFVDSSCIDCDACRQIAPTVFRDTGVQSAVFHQPRSEWELLAAQKALISCPTSSIGMSERHDMTAALGSYPEAIAEEVFRCGFTSERSFGAFSYLIRRDRGGGNVLIDSPRFSGPLVRNLDLLGGVSRMLLTHVDDVADHEKFHERFGCPRVMHADDIRGRTASIESKPSGIEPLALDPDLLMIPTPGHTKGHAVYLYRDQFLFTGDHLAWSESLDHLYAFRDACWFSWSEQIRSMERLLDHRFEWVLPGHGRPVRLDAAAMRASLIRCIEWMKRR